MCCLPVNQISKPEGQQGTGSQEAVRPTFDELMRARDARHYRCEHGTPLHRICRYCAGFADPAIQSPEIPQEPNSGTQGSK